MVYHYRRKKDAERVLPYLKLKIPPQSAIYVIKKHSSKSGTMTVFDMLLIEKLKDDTDYILSISLPVATALRMAFDDKHHGIRYYSKSDENPAFELVGALSSLLFGKEGRISGSGEGIVKGEKALKFLMMK